VYEELQVAGYLVDYERVPITDEKSPKEMDFDILVSILSGFVMLYHIWYHFPHTYSFGAIKGLGNVVSFSTVLSLSCCCC